MECMRIRKQMNCDNCKYHGRGHDKAPCNIGIYEMNRCHKTFCFAWEEQLLIQIIFYNLKKKILKIFRKR